jgi:superfamily II DNA or RNA helicase
VNPVRACSVVHLEDSPGALAFARKQAVIPNPRRAEAERLGRYFKNIPARLEYWHRSTFDTIVVPRGLAPVSSYRNRPADLRVSIAADVEQWAEPELRDYQAAALSKLVAAEQGVLQFPTGAGKTHTALALARQLGQRTIVIVNSKSLMEQWIERVRMTLDIEPGVIGGGKKLDLDRDLVIATQPTLQRDPERFGLDEFGCVVWDEVHHLPARTFYSVSLHLPARYRFGLSATPEKKVGWERLVTFALGDVVVSHDRTELEQAGAIVTPDARVIPSDFDYPYNTPDDWHDLLHAVVHDQDRCQLIALVLAAGMASGRSVLLAGQRLDFLHNVRNLLLQGINAESLPLLIGETKDRSAVYERVAKGACALFSTLAGEALDLPRLDGLVIAYPYRNDGAVEQLVGRLSRPHDAKAAPRVVDLCDEQGVLGAQHNRRRSVYARLGMPVSASTAAAAWA